MTIAITGGSGFIGRNLTQLLEAAGHQVRVLGRNSGKFRWDPMSGPPPQQALENVDAIIHLAGEPIAQRWTDEAKRKIEQTRIVGTRNLVAGIKQMAIKPKVLASSSGVGIYGDRGDELLTEGSLPGGTWLSQVAIAWEREAMAAEQFGVRTVCLRTAMVLGKEGALPKMALPFRLGVGGPIAGGTHWVSWIHIADLCRLFEFVLRADLRGPVNACATEPVTNAVFTRALGEALHRWTIFPVPAFAIKLLYGDMAAVVLESQRAIPQAAEQAGFRFEHTEVSGALKDLL
jgi:uncharacterized protein